MMYIRLFVLVLVMILAVVLLWYRGQYLSALSDRAAVEAALSVANEANRQQKQAIERITALRAQNDAILLDISERLDGITSNVIETNAAVSDLENTNETVRDYLAKPIPDELRRLFNNH